MIEEDFCKILIYSLLNFICYYLSIIFLTSTYNVKSQANYYYKFECKNNNKMYDKQYNAIASFFALITIGFFTYIIALIIVIKKNKLDLETKNINRKENNITNDEDINDNKNDIKSGPYSDERIIEYKDNISNISNNSGDRRDKMNDSKKEMFFLFFSFIACQFIYFIELIILSSSHRKSKNEEPNCRNIKNITKIYTVLLIVGYILFSIFIVCYIYLFILYYKLAKGAEKRLKILTNSSYCECFNECLKKNMHKLCFLF